MMALLRIAVLKMSLYDKGATYGSNLQNLKYRNEWNHQAGARETGTETEQLQRPHYGQGGLPPLTPVSLFVNLIQVNPPPSTRLCSLFRKQPT
jgi:hypothetical protein